MNKKTTIIGILLVFTAAISSVAVLYAQKLTQKPRPVFSDRTMLDALWYNYSLAYIEPNSGRTVDKQQNNVTTSEGQSYSMLRAVWQDDRENFDRSWKFTKDNLQRPDKLFSWRYGELPNGEFGILTAEGGNNTASDGDVDIALALIMAYSRWQEPEYLSDAQEIINSIWEKEVVLVNGRPVLAANDLEKASPNPEILVNPSYFAPYAFKAFANIDTKHPWQKLADNSYEVIAQASSTPLDQETSANIPPNWVNMNRSTGAIRPVPAPSLTTDYGFDAMRTSWRLALDYQWNKDERAKSLLESFGYLGKEWSSDQRLVAEYFHNGVEKVNYESIAMYGGSMGFYAVARPEQAKAIYESKLLSLYDGDKRAWRETLSYYDDNWAWFGLALYKDALPNLPAEIGRK